MSSSSQAKKKQKLDNASDNTETNYKGVFDGQLGFGKKCAVLVVDFCNAYTNPESLNYCGGEGFGVVDAVAQSVDLLDLARSKNVPIVYTRY
jgi:maleamate amidohydrolase